MAIRADNAFKRFYDSTGTLDLDSGTVEFTVNNDVGTQIAIFSDMALTIAQTNPYTLDAAGRIIGDVWMDNILFTMVIKDSSGATVRTINDNGDADPSDPASIVAESNNRFRNGGMSAIDGDAITLTTGLLEGKVTGVFASMTGVTGGTFGQAVQDNIGSSGTAAAMLSVSAGATGEAKFAINMPRESVFDLVEESIVFQEKIRHDITGSKNAYFELWCPTSVNDFDSSLTQIYDGSGDVTAVNANTTTLITDIVDISANAQKALVKNGLQVVLVLVTGSTSTDNVWVSDFSLTMGNVLLDYITEPLEIQESTNIAPTKERFDLLAASFNRDEQTESGLLDFGVTAGRYRDGNAVSTGAASVFTLSPSVTTIIAINTATDALVAVTSLSTADQIALWEVVTDGTEITSAVDLRLAKAKVSENVAQTIKTSAFTSTANATWTDITGMSVAITPTATSSDINITCSLNTGNGGNNFARGYRILRGSTVISEGDATTGVETMFSGYTSLNGGSGTITMAVKDSPATTSATTYKVQFFNPASSTTGVFINRPHTISADSFNGVSTITATEIVQ